MKAVVVKQPGGAEQLVVREMPVPEYGRAEILIEVKAAAINRTDIIHRESALGYMDNPIIGIEVAGLVVEAGADTKLAIGTPVMGLVNGGAYAEYAVMPADRAMVIPDNLSFVEAVAIPEVFLTAYQTLYWHGKLAKGETAFIHAAGSGVGTAAIQLAKHISHAKIITTAGSAEKLDFAKELGAHVGINYKTEDFPSKVLQATDNAGADVILDFVGASYWEKNLQSIAIDGRWVLIGILGGTEVERMNLWPLMEKRVQLIGTLLTPRSDAYKAALTTEFIEKTLPYFISGEIRPIVDSVFSLEQVQQAHERMENNENIGKIVLEI